MKATRRQELRTNELAETLDSLREFFEKHGNYVVGAVVVVALVALVYVYKDRSARQALADARQEMRALAFNTDDEVRDSVAALTRLAADSKEDSFIRETLRLRARLAMDRAGAADDGTPSAEFLEMARAAYEESLSRYPDAALDRAASLMGLATVEEDLFVLDQDPSHKQQAREYLERVRDDQALNGMPFQSIALERLNALDGTFRLIVLAETPPPPMPLGPLMGPPASLAPDAPAEVTAAPGTGTAEPETVVWSPDKQPKVRVQGATLERVSADQVPQDVRDRAAASLAERDAQKAADAAAKSAADTTPEPAETSDETPAETSDETPAESSGDTPAEQDEQATE
jgi:hypothetical protein